MKLRIARKILKSAATRGVLGIAPRHRRSTVEMALGRTRVQVTVATMLDFSRTVDMLRAIREDTIRSAGIRSLLPKLEPFDSVDMGKAFA
jgi:hypothetical protein